MRISDWSSDVCSSDLHRVDLFSKVAREAILLLLVKIGFVHRAAGEPAAAGGGRLARGVGLDVAVLAVLALAVRGGAQVDPLLVALIAQEQRLAAVGDEDEGVVGEDRKSTRLNSSH